MQMETRQVQITSRMEELLAAWEAAGDKKRIFLDCYWRMTRNMLSAVDEGRFEDPLWVKGLLHHFADYYFDALSCVERAEEEAPRVWLHAFKAASNPGTTTLQNLLLGVNAHINYDLVFALADILSPQWVSASEDVRGMRYRDHCRVNIIIGETVDEVQDQVVERFAPGMDIVDKLGGPVDEWFASWLIARWREEVWKRAGELLVCSSAGEREAIRQRVESSAMERAHLLLLV